LPDIEDRLYHTFIGIFLDALPVGTLSQDQRQGAKDDGLSRTGLARDDGKAFFKLNI